MLQYIPVLWPIIKKLLEGRGLITDKDEERKFQIEMIELAQKEEEWFTKALESVNATMRAEAKSEHWAQWLWRPLVGFAFVAVIVNNYILMPYLQTYLQPIEIPGRVWDAMLMILGVAAATRGWQKIEQARNGKNGVGGDAKAEVVGPQPGPAPVRPTAPPAPPSLEGSSMVEHRPVKPTVEGSSPSPPASRPEPFLPSGDPAREDRVRHDLEYLEKRFGRIEMPDWEPRRDGVER